MAKVNTYQTKRQSLQREHVEGAPAVVVGTIMAADLYRQNTLAGIELYEFPGYVVWAKGGELAALSFHLGDETDEWPHRAVVLEMVRRNNPHSGETVDKYVVAPAGQWDALAATLTGEPAAPPPPAPPHARKLRPRPGALGPTGVHEA
jgi:hypothetical protein